MTEITWDAVPDRTYETGVDHGVLYPQSDSGLYDHGFAWNGLTAVTESPTGAEATPTYADNIKYLNLISVEQFGGTIAAYTYPDEFGQCDGTAEPEAGVKIGQQSRRTFGMCYRTRVGNPIQGTDYGYKLHLVYGALAAPSEKAYNTINETPEAIDFSWTFTTTPVEVGTIDDVFYKPTAILTIDSTKVDPTALADLQAILYGSEGVDPSLPPPATVVALFSGSVTTVTPTKPSQTVNDITIPVITGVEYRVSGVVVTGTYTLTEDTIITANPTAGHVFPPVTDDDWLFIYTP
jgi:hypothetical protein